MTYIEHEELWPCYRWGVYFESPGDWAAYLWELDTGESYGPFVNNNYLDGRVAESTPSPKPSPTPTPKLPPDNTLLLTASDAASLCRVGERTWHRMNSEEQCPAPVKLGGSVRWNRDELREWISAGCSSRAEWEKKLRYNQRHPDLSR